VGEIKIKELRNIRNDTLDRYNAYQKVAPFGQKQIGMIVSAGIKLIQPIAQVWLLPTPAMAISEMPTGESQGPMEAQLQWIKVPSV
jgi:hypothetical protein